MALIITQDNRPLQTAVSPLGPNDLIPVAFHGEEEVSAPFAFTVDFVSTNAAIAASSLLGKPMSIRIAMEGGRERFVHGIVRKFGSRGKFRELYGYRAELVPSLWLLGLATDCRTFEQKSVRDIVTAVLRQGGAVPDFEFKVTATLKPRPFTVQYRETNLAFVERLLEEEGLYYFFKHSKDKHMLVISDAHAGSIPAGAVAEVKVVSQSSAGDVEPDAVFELSREFTVHSASVSLKDHDLLRADSIGAASSGKPGASGELYEFLGDLGPNDSSRLATLAIEAEEADHDQLQGEGTCAAFEPGSRVKLTGGMLGAGGAELHLLSVRHRCEGGDVLSSSGLGATYTNEFTAMPAATRYRPPVETAWPSVQGTQVAKVVGSGAPGDIDVDANGRVLLQFPWDRGDGRDGKSKHRVHAASVWAGAGWGFVQLPRIGQEVLVEFLEGDPDRPIITGRVYNASNMHPYGLPANKTQSGVKTRSVGGGDANFNELRFEDKKGDEQVYLHAEKNLDTVVENDETLTVGHDRTKTIEHDETWHVKNDRTGTVDNNQALTVGQDVTVDIGSNETVTIGGDQTLTVGEHRTVSVAKNRTVDVGKDDQLAVGGNLTADIAKKILIKAGDELVLKCGSASITLKKDGSISIQGMKIEAKADTDVSIKGAKIAAEGQAQAEFKGAMVKIEGQAMTTIKGAIAQVTGDGMLKAGGGISMIG